MYVCVHVCVRVCACACDGTGADLSFTNIFRAPSPRGPEQPIVLVSPKVLACDCAVQLRETLHSSLPCPAEPEGARHWESPGSGRALTQILPSLWVGLGDGLLVPLAHHKDHCLSHQFNQQLKQKFGIASVKW